MRGVLWVSVLLGCVLLVACPGPPGRERVSEVDEQRLRVMLDLPILRDAEQVSQRPGTLLNPRLGWDRGYVSANLFTADPREGAAPVTPEQVKAETADALQQLRDTGWTIMSALCEAPPRDRLAASTPPLPSPDDIDSDPARDWWTWSATAYTHLDGVSYWAELTGGAVRTGAGFVGIQVRAPNLDDPPDLFPDRPPDLPPGSTCLEEPGVAPVLIQQGSRIEISERGRPAHAPTDPIYR